MFFYIHVPFCQQKCQYCKFALTPRFDELKIRAYIDTLKREIEGVFSENPLNLPSPSKGEGLGVRGNSQILAAPLCREGIQIETIYFGGGTPSILTPAQISEILDVFRSNGHFPSYAEITLEANPEDITDEYLADISKL